MPLLSMCGSGEALCCGWELRMSGGVRFDLGIAIPGRQRQGRVPVVKVSPAKNRVSIILECFLDRYFLSIYLDWKKMVEPFGAWHA